LLITAQDQGETEAGKWQTWRDINAGRLPEPRVIRLEKGDLRKSARFAGRKWNAIPKAVNFYAPTAITPMRWISPVACGPMGADIPPLLTTVNFSYTPANSRGLKASGLFTKTNHAKKYFPYHLKILRFFSVSIWVLILQ
jgi:hypothetical protein